jgi:hypothetical protein
LQKTRPDRPTRPTPLFPSIFSYNLPFWEFLKIELL